MKSSTARHILSGVVAIAIAAALTVPAMAAEDNEIRFNSDKSSQNGDSMSIIETVNSLDTNKPIPSLNITPRQAITRYNELEREYDATSDAEEKSKIEEEMKRIKAAFKEAYPGVDFGFLEKSPQKTETPVNDYETPVGERIEYFFDNGMYLMFSLSDSSERTTLTEEEVTTFLGKLKELESLLPSASSTQLERAKSTMQSFRDVVLMYKNSETLVAAVNAFLSRLALSGQNTEPATTPFTDVPDTAWYAQDVAQVQALGIIQGKGNGLFDPDGTLTVAQAITLAAKTRAYHNQETIATVEGGSWYSGALEYAKAQGIISGNEFSNYDANATRGEMAYLFARALPDTEYKAINSITELPDVTGATKYSTQIFSLYNAGIVAGSNAYGTFNPNSNIQRSEAAAIILRVVDRTERKTLSLEPSVTVKPETPSAGSMVNAKGQMTHDYASQYILDSMNTARVYKENGKYYISCTLADLPDGFYWQPGADVYHDDDGYLFCTFDGDWVDSKGTIKIELEGVTSISDIAPVSFSLHIKSEENQGTAVSYKILSSYQGKIRMSSDEKGDKWIDYDTSAIFAGIK